MGTPREKLRSNSKHQWRVPELLSCHHTHQHNAMFPVPKHLRELRWGVPAPLKLLWASFVAKITIFLFFLWSFASEDTAEEPREMSCGWKR